MILPDVNVLIYAFRPDAPDHALCKSWLEAIVGSENSFGISPLTLSALVRVTTNTRSYRLASSLDDAFRFCDALLGQPNCERVEPGSNHWDIFQRLCKSSKIRGADVTDAWYAALAIEWGCEWITFDRDFARFSGLKWSVPKAH